MAKEADGSRRLVLQDRLQPGPLSLGEAEARYAGSVLRLRPGDVLSLLDGAGGLAKAEVLALGRRALELQVFRVEQLEPPAGPRLELVQAIGKGDKFEDLLRRATELGAARITPLYTERGLRPEPKPRWAAVLDDALRICGRRFRPELSPPLSVAELAARPRAALSLALAGQGAAALAEALPAEAPARVELVIGPEGGLSPAERTQLEEAGFSLVHLGPRTLRTQSAGPAALAILGHVYGGLYR